MSDEKCADKYIIAIEAKNENNAWCGCCVYASEEDVEMGDDGCYYARVTRADDVGEGGGRDVCMRRWLKR